MKVFRDRKQIFLQVSEDELQILETILGTTEVDNTPGFDMYQTIREAVKNPSMGRQHLNFE